MISDKNKQSRKKQKKTPQNPNRFNSVSEHYEKRVVGDIKDGQSEVPKATTKVDFIILYIYICI